MKIGGIEVTKCEELLVIPREGGDIPFRAKAVEINNEFDNLVPSPVAPMIMAKSGKRPDITDPDYKRAVTVRNELRFAFMIIRSLEPSNIEWGEVDLEKPSTWTKWDDELKKAGLSETEVNRVVGAVMIANSLDEDKIKEAREAFLRGQGA